MTNRTDFATEVVKHIIATDDTIRATAKKFNISKSSIGVLVRSGYVPHELRRDLDTILKKHFAEKHIRGGESTKRKYAALAAARQKK